MSTSDMSTSDMSTSDRTTSDVTRRVRGGRLIAVMIGALLATAGLLALAAAGAMVVAHQTLRDADGFYRTPTARVETSSAVIMSPLDLGSPSDDDDWMLDRSLATLCVRASAVDQGALFVGIAPADAVQRWLGTSAYQRVTGVSFGPFRVDSHRVAGTPTVAPPGAQSFWVASTSGPGPQSLAWPSERGQWAVVIMNADARGGVAADVSVGAKTDLLLPAGGWSAGAGLVLLAVGLAVMLVALRGTAPAAAAGAAGVGAVATPTLPGAYPVRLDGELAPRLSRGLWLVKWLLVLPHVVVLALLWLAFLALSVVAGVAILVTGRYPRAIFDVNVGVLRWTWRVSFYAFSALGTDRYPPFSLYPDPTYPADLTVDYPQRLSRGLVLVKWWLLAIPHYLVVSLFVGGWTVYASDPDGSWRRGGNFGLITILVLVAAVVLLFTGRYPASVFDLVLGLNRWAYRVLAYAALMRDEYPPFRLDAGGTDPGAGSPSRPGGGAQSGAP